MFLTFLSILLIYSGFILGLGAVTVIDIHGFLGRTSLYWTKATISTHKITKILIWIGTALNGMGLFIYIYLGNNNIFILVSLSILVILILNGLFLSFNISPKLLKMESDDKIVLLDNHTQVYIFVSFIISFISWWSNFLILTYVIFQNAFR